MEQSPGQVTSWATNKASVNLRKMKSYQASFPTTTLQDQKSTTEKKKKYIYIKHKHKEAKQPVDHYRNQRGNQKMPRDQ